MSGALTGYHFYAALTGHFAVVAGIGTNTFHRSYSIYAPVTWSFFTSTKIWSCKVVARERPT